MFRSFVAVAQKMNRAIPMMATLALLLGSVGQAKAGPLTVISFDNVSSVPQDFSTYAEGGYTLTPFFPFFGDPPSGDVRVGDYNTPGNNYAFASYGFDDMRIVVTNDANTPFSFRSVDVFNGVYFNESLDTYTLIVEGTKADLTTVSQTITFVGTHTPQFFSDFSDFTNLISLSFGGNIGSSSERAAIDNITLETSSSPVPEPASMITLAAGAIGMLGFRMRKRKAAAGVAA